MPVFAGTALLAVAAVAFAIGAFPGSAHAAGYYDGYYGYSPYNCPNPVVYTNGYYYCNRQPTVSYTQPTYPTYSYPTYPAVTVSCYANTSSVPVGGSAQWIAQASGGAGYYTYTWSGTDGLTGSGQTSYMSYYNPGLKTASVIVYSGGQSMSAVCGNSVNVYDQGNYYYGQSSYNNYNYSAYPTYVQPTPIYNSTTVLNSNASGLDIGCYANPANALVNQPVTWNVEVTGGALPYKYSWSGSDGLTSSSNTAVTYYQTSGSKNALVTVTSADGRTGTMACSNTVTVTRPGGSSAGAPTQQPAQQPSPQGNLSASAAFSLGSIPWGWVAVLVILVLFGTVMYLLFNKPKI